MGKSSFISSFDIRNRLPLGAIGGVALFFITCAVAFNSYAFWKFIYLYSSPSSDDPIRMEAQLHLMPEDKANCRILLIGSSQTIEDFDAVSINRRLSSSGKVAYNLGLSGDAQPIRMYMITDDILPVKPGVVVYMPFMGSLYSDYDYTFMPCNFEPKILPYFLESLGPSEVIAHTNMIMQSLAGKFLKIVRYQASIERILIRYIGDVMRGASRTQPDLHLFKENQPDYYFEDEVRKAGDMKYHEGRYTALNKECFTLFARQVLDSGARLLVISGPTHPRLKECYPQSLGIAFDEFFRGQAQQLGFTYLDGSCLPAFTSADFADFLHLNKLGRDKMSDFLSDYMDRDITFKSK